MPTPLNYRGDFPNYIVKSLERDKTGIYSGQVEVPRKISTTNQKIDPAWLDPSRAPFPWSIPCVSARAEITPPICTIIFNYEGVEPNWSGSTEAEIQFEIDTSMNEAPIETHPAFPLLKRMYGWDKVQRMFSEFLEEAVSGAAALDPQQTEGKTNILFGTDSFLEIGAIYRETYSSRIIPGDLWDHIGAIVQAPSGVKQFRLPLGANRNWLGLAPKATRKGNAVEIVREWMLSGFRGWLSPIYSLAQLQSSSRGDASGSGLSTSGLITGHL